MPAMSLISLALLLAAVPDPALAAAIRATERFEVPGQPCLARPDAMAELSLAERKRQREVRSDSHWLNRLVRERYGDRLAFSGLTVEGGRLRHVVWLTGTAPIPPLRLRHRAADVPVEIRYNAPWSIAEVFRRRAAVAPMLKHLVPDVQGESYREGPDAAWIELDVYSPDGRPLSEVLALCDKLRAAYRLPVLIRFTAGRLELR